MNNNNLIEEELDRYQQMIQEVLDYIMQHQDNENAKQKIENIHDWCC